jgi:hypothetical protein
MDISNDNILLSRCANKIKKMWKKYTYTIGLKKIYTYVKSTLTKDDLQELTNKCKSINNMCSGDGAGLLGGCLVDILLSKYFKEKFTDNYQELHVGESDMRICDVNLSLKKINGNPP